MDIVLHREREVFQRIQVLRECGSTLQKRLGMALRPLRLMAGSSVYEEGYDDTNTYFVYHGSVDLTRGHNLSGSFLKVRGERSETEAETVAETEAKVEAEAQ